jgi:CheY-like chemotaxis protein
LPKEEAEGTRGAIRQFSMDTARWNDCSHFFQPTSLLLVDDEEVLVKMGQVMLERLGYTVTTRTNSLEALTTFKNQADQFDAVVTDQTMPGITGVDLARMMLQIRPDIPIILCTGFSTLVNESQARAFGIKEFAMKPPWSGKNWPPF